MENLRVERLEGFAVVRLDKGRGNAIDEPLVEDLLAACAALQVDRSVSGVLLASAHPKLFCPGLDLVALSAYDRPAMRRFMLRFAEAVQALYALRKPVVAALAGHAVAGGCVLALTADWRILRSEGATIGLNEVRVGVPLPWSVSLLLSASIRPERVAEVALLGRNLGAEEAIGAGLVQELAPSEGFEEACLARLRDFAERDAPSLGATKSHLRSATLDAMKAHEARHIEEWLDCWFSEATRARIRATVESLGRSRP
jgi:3,2-trans-enoyl-CoA isomerase